MASIFFRTILIYIMLSISIKIMGKRQIGELEVGELVSTLLISEIASLPIADPDIPLLNAIIPVLLLVCLEIIISTVKNKSQRLKKIIEGMPTFIVYRGKLMQSALRENRISVNELLAEMRIQGVGDIKDIKYALLEQNGKLSLIKEDEGNLAHAIIIDGDIEKGELKKLGYDEGWVRKKLSCEGVRTSEIFLMTVDDSGNINIIRKEK